MERRDICRALNVSDEKQCLEVATSSNGLFCAFHSRQCYGLYRGYKKRNARLDRLSANPPPYLAQTKIPLANQFFTDVTTEAVLKEIHDHLFLKHQLLNKVIQARKLHMTRFFSQDMDYGHTNYVNGLMGLKAATTVALERLERRTAEVLYEDQKWFGWVRECQNEEERNREKEQKKVKLEAAMFKRNWKANEMRQREMRAKEEKLRQDAFLEQIYKERMKQKESEIDEDDEEWDPIDDVLEDSRGSYVDLIQNFLWMETTKPEEKESAPEATIQSAEPPALAEVTDVVQNLEVEAPKTASASHSKQKAKAKKKQKPANTKPAAEAEPDISLIETKEQMFDRLVNSVELTTSRVKGLIIAGTPEKPTLSHKTLTYSEAEAHRLQSEITEIKHLLFCRLLLGHATLLPAALRAENVESFLADQEVPSSALRDLCLKMEIPGLQEIRDACADFFRSDEEAEEVDMKEKAAQKEKRKKMVEEPHPHDLMMKPMRGKHALPDTWKPKREQAKELEQEEEEEEEDEEDPMGMPSRDQILGGGPDSGGQAVDFGKVSKKKLSKEKIKVRVCGRSIWNYPSDKAMTRGGWLHFCIIAKESTLHDAVALCRHWDEFFELNILALWDYFPSKKWGEWVGNRYRMQMLQLGFIMYFESSSPDAAELTVSHQQSGRRGNGRRAHAVFEARNFICAHIKRDDPQSRRLIQYLSMQSHKLVILVRDAESGKLLVTPDEEERWLYREKSGLGRASKNNFNVVRRVGSVFFEEMDKLREWKFSFKEYYDVYIWDLEPGQPFPVLFNTIQEMLIKALRCKQGLDTYELAAPILKTLHRDPDTDIVRDIKPGESIQSIYDLMHSEKMHFFYGSIKDMKDAIKAEDEEAINQVPKNLFYNDIDALEDEILFPEDSGSANPLGVGDLEPISKWEKEGHSLRPFIEGWESDYSDSDIDEQDLDSEDLDPDDEDDSWEEGETIDMSVARIQRAVIAKNAKDRAKKGDDSPVKADELIARLSYPEAWQEAFRKLTLKIEREQFVDRGSPAVMKDEFMELFDKRKASVFKEVWHKADLTPHAQVNYVEMTEMARKARQWNQLQFGCIQDIIVLQIIDKLDVPVGDIKAAYRAMGKISPFFRPEFFESAQGKPFKDSLLFKQEERAQKFPDIRSHQSNTTCSKELFTDYDEKLKAGDYVEDFPEEWDRTVRPIVAHLYKTGILRTRADTYHEGQAFAAAEPGRTKMDFYLDYRSNIPTITGLHHLTNPSSVPTLKTTALAFAAKNPNACFSILTLWSAPHFYPLTIGFDKRGPTSFQDMQGRKFVWLFIPKDMPCSEYSVHENARQRIEPFQKKVFGKGKEEKVVVRRDKYLVMGKDREECFWLSAAMVYAVQRRPWRLEVDLWRSFVGVDKVFLERLDEKWLD